MSSSLFINDGAKDIQLGEISTDEARIKFKSCLYSALSIFVPAQKFVCLAEFVVGRDAVRFELNGLSEACQGGWVKVRFPLCAYGFPPFYQRHAVWFSGGHAARSSVKGFVLSL